MKPPSLSFRLVPGVPARGRRGVGFLEGDPQLNAGNAFDGFELSTKGILRRHMDTWISLIDDRPKQYHAFRGDYKELSVFKHVAEGIRLYGFRCHPIQTFKRFELIALCIFDLKFEDNTDLTVLKKVERWRTYSIAQAVIEAFDGYPPPPLPGGSRR